MPDGGKEESWQRNFGFTPLYDAAAAFTGMYYDTMRLKFNYDNMDWMIQIWKGNYTVANGGEVGVYCRDASRSGSFYDCANNEQMLNMSMQILHGDKVLVDEGPMMHWWVNGFNLSDRMYLPESLTMKFSIVMTDEEMLNAFCEAIDKHYMHDVSYTVDELTVNRVLYVVLDSYDNSLVHLIAYNHTNSAFSEISFFCHDLFLLTRFSLKGLSLHERYCA